MVMEDYVRRRRMQPMLDLRGKVHIGYDWEEEELELKAVKEQAYHHCT